MEQTATFFQIKIDAQSFRVFIISIMHTILLLVYHFYLYQNVQRLNPALLKFV